MDDLKNTLNNMLDSNIALRKAYSLYYINRKWSEIVNKDIADKTFVERISRSVLYVLTCSPVWSNQLSFLKPQLLKKIKEVIGIEEIRDLKFNTTSLSEISRIKADIMGLEDETETPFLHAENPEYLEKLEIPWDNSHGISDELQLKLTRIYSKDKTFKSKKTQNGWKPCILCGTLIKTKNENCPTCISKVRKDKDYKIIKYIKEAPWAKFADFYTNHKNINEQEFHRVKEDYKEQLRDEIYKKISLYLKEGNEVFKSHIKRELNIYVMLASSLQPQYIHDEIIKKKIGRRVFNILYGPVE